MPRRFELNRDLARRGRSLRQTVQLNEVLRRRREVCGDFAHAALGRALLKVAVRRYAILLGEVSVRHGKVPAVLPEDALRVRDAEFPYRQPAAAGVFTEHERGRHPVNQLRFKISGRDRLRVRDVGEALQRDVLDALRRDVAFEEHGSHVERRRRRD